MVDQLVSDGWWWLLHGNNEITDNRSKWWLMMVSDGEWWLMIAWLIDNSWFSLSHLSLSLSSSVSLPVSVSLEIRSLCNRAFRSPFDMSALSMTNKKSKTNLLPSASLLWLHGFPTSKHERIPIAMSNATTKRPDAEHQLLGWLSYCWFSKWIDHHRPFLLVIPGHKSWWTTLTLCKQMTLYWPFTYLSLTPIINHYLFPVILSSFYQLIINQPLF